MSELLTLLGWVVEAAIGLSGFLPHAAVDGAMIPEVNYQHQPSEKQITENRNKHNHWQMTDCVMVSIPVCFQPVSFSSVCKQKSPEIFFL